MIKTFADKQTEELFTSGRSKRLPQDLLLHKLGGNREGQHAIAINDQWRICFRFVEGHAYDVEVTDYH